MQEDQYTQEDQNTPPDGQAVCPTCGHGLTGAPRRQPALQLAGHTWRCPVCGQVWIECYTPAAVARYWQPIGRGPS